MEVPFFDYPELYNRFADQFDATFSDVCSRGAFILGQDLEAFEAELAQNLGASHAIGVADGTNAIALGLTACGIGQADEVVMSPHTYVATAAAVQAVGATPVLADIGSDGLLDAGAAKAAIGENTRAIMPTQLNGRVCDMGALGYLARDHDLTLIEDAAQAMGARFQGQNAGTFGAFGTLSFYPAKLLGCFGDGGAVLTNDPELADRVRRLRDHGRNKQGEFVDRGTNSRLDNLQAAFLRIRLQAFDQDIARRREIATMYHDALSDIGDLDLPPRPSGGPHFDVFQNYEIQTDARDRLRQFLGNQGIATVIQWGGQTLDRIAALKLAPATVPQARRYIERSLLLPMNMALTNWQLDHVISSVRGFFRGTA